MSSTRDIFNRDVSMGGPLSADATRLVVPFVGGEDFMMQSVNLQYGQKVTRLWELGSSKTFLFAGRTEGTIALKRIVGIKNVALAFVKQFGDVCNMLKNHLSLTVSAGCVQTNNRGKITASGCVITSVAYSAQAQEMIINEDIQMMFVRMN